MIKINGYQLEGSFPTVIRPENKFDRQEFLDSLKENKEDVRQLLLQQGGLIFRDFPVKGAIDFGDVVEALGFGDFVDYIGGDSPRDRVDHRVYTSTEAPPSFPIPLHQELSYVKKFPRHIYFHCEIAAPVGGATIIGDIRKVSRLIDPRVMLRFKEHGLVYTSRYYHNSKVMQYLNKYQRSHKSWPEVFETHDKNKVEQMCLDNEFNYKWLPSGWIEIRQTRPAVVIHPETYENVWFNQAHLYDFNPRLLGWKNYIGAKIFYFRRSTLLHEIAFADGTPIPKKDLYHILDVLDACTVNYPWQSGDVMILDNILAMHGREPFSGKRRVLTAMTD